MAGQVIRCQCTWTEYRDRIKHKSIQFLVRPHCSELNQLSFILIYYYL